MGRLIKGWRHRGYYNLVYNEIMNKLFENIFIISLAIVFTTAALVGMFGGGEAVYALLANYVFDVQSCYYAPMVKDAVEPVRECVRDIENFKRSMAEGLSKLIIAGSVAAFTYHKLAKTLK